MSRKEFFVLYDYGQGGLWAVLRADSADQIRQRYPSLQIFETAPSMLSRELLAEIRRTDSFDIDDPPLSWLSEFTEGGAASSSRGGRNR